MNRRKVEQGLAVALRDQVHAIVPANTAVLQGPRPAREAVLLQVGADLGEIFNQHSVSLESSGADGVRETVRLIIEQWREARPGLRSLVEAHTILADPELAPTMSLALASAQLAEAKGGPTLLLVDDVDFGNVDHAPIVSAIANLDQRAAGLAAVIGTGVHTSFIEQSPDIKVLEIWSAAGRAADTWSTLASDLSIDATRYLRSAIHDPATHDALRKRLGDSNAFGRGPSPLGLALAELRQAGFVRIDHRGVIQVTDPAIVEYMS